jgi:hypothetical protein
MQAAWAVADLLGARAQGSGTHRIIRLTGNDEGASWSTSIERRPDGTIEARVYLDV